MAEHIREILKTGDYSLRQKLLKKYPPTILEVLELQSLGAEESGVALQEYFRAATVADVEKLAREEKLRDLPGFGEKSEQNILKAAEQFKNLSGSSRVKIDMAEDEARTLRRLYRQSVRAGGIGDAGGFAAARPRNRGRSRPAGYHAAGHDKQKDIDAVAEHILKYPAIRQTLAHGENKVSVLLESRLQVDVRLLRKKILAPRCSISPDRRSTMWRLRGRANDMGWTLNEYALTTLKGGKVVASKTEQEIYAKLKLAYIEPELREDDGRNRSGRTRQTCPTSSSSPTFAAICKCTPRHPTGKTPSRKWARPPARSATNTSRLPTTRKPSPSPTAWTRRRTLAQIKKIRAAQERVPGIRLLAGIEVDILKDGTLDLDNEVLAQLDVVVASVHSYMKMERAEMTERMLAAIENPYTQIIAHPTGRLVLRREPFDYDMEKIFDAAAKHGVAMECNAYPDRLDLKDVHLRMAKQRGVKIVISTDSHRANHLAFMKYGVKTARRGWIEKQRCDQRSAAGGFSRGAPPETEFRGSSSAVSKPPVVAKTRRKTAP